MYRLCKIALVILMGVACTTGKSQLVKLFEIPVAASFIETDNFQNLYVVRSEEIIKYNSEGKKQFVYSNMQMGQVTGLDVTYPLRPLVEYSLINHIVLLDNTLSSNRNPVNLQKNPQIGLAELSATSVQNYFWFFDAMNFELVRCNDKFEPVVRTGNLPQLLRIELEPTYLREFDNRVYLNNPATGILVFDIYGTYIKTIPLKSLNKFQVSENEIRYSKGGNFYSLNINLSTEAKMETGFTDALDIQRRGNLLFVQLEKAVEVYKIVQQETKP